MAETISSNPIKKEFSLLVVDVSRAWEETLKDNERGYILEFDFDFRKEKKQEGYHWHEKPVPPEFRSLKYPFGTPRAGLDAIIDTVRLAHEKHRTIYAAAFDDGCTNDDLPCESLKHYIPETNVFRKTSYSAFRSGKLAQRLQDDNCKSLLILGYDRDCCVLQTVQDAVANNMTVYTSERIMLSIDLDNKRNQSLEYYRKHTQFLESLADVWNLF